MKKAALMFGVVISMAVVGFGQRTITNATLEKFQQKRLAAEREYRENYARMGFPSPEELERQRQADMTARLQLAEQLRQARLARERLELERERLSVEAAQLEEEEFEEVEYPTFYGGFVTGGGFGGFDLDRRHYRRTRRPFTGFTLGNRRFFTPRPGYRVTPFQVIPVPNQRPAPILRRGRRF
jgi:hypothetical protein